MNITSTLKNYASKPALYLTAAAIIGASVACGGSETSTVPQPTTAPQPTITQQPTPTSESIDDTVANIPELFQVVYFNRDDEGFSIEFFMEGGRILYKVIATDDHGNSYEGQLVTDSELLPEGFVYRVDHITYGPNPARPTTAHSGIWVDMPGAAPLIDLKVGVVRTKSFPDKFYDITLQNGEPVLEEIIGGPIDWNSDLPKSIYAGEDEKLSQFLEVRVGNPNPVAGGKVLYTVEIENLDYNDTVVEFYPFSGPQIQGPGGKVWDVNRSKVEISSANYNNTFIRIPGSSTESVSIEYEKGANAEKGSLLILTLDSDGGLKYLILPVD